MRLALWSLAVLALAAVVFTVWAVMRIGSRSELQLGERGALHAERRERAKNGGSHVKSPTPSDKNKE